MWNLQRSLPKNAGNVINAVLHWYMQYTNALDMHWIVTKYKMFCITIIIP